MRMRRVKWMGWMLVLAAGCSETEQNFGSAQAGGAGGSAGTASAGSSSGGAGGTASGGSSGSAGVAGAAGSGGVLEQTEAASEFEWLNPKPHGDGFRVVAANGDSNLWVGGRGELLAWNGSAWTTHRPGDFSDLYHGLWVRGAGDVWVAGTQLKWAANSSAATEHGVLMHYNGSSWQPEPGYEARVFRGVAGTPRLGLAALDAGDVLINTGSAWQLESTPAQHELRALWVAGDDTAWAVGDAGTLLRRDAQGWASSGAAPETAADRNYIGVWGASPTDVWAVYETAILDGRDPHDDNSLIGRIGFVHFDGSSWTTQQTAEAECAKELDGVEPYPSSLHSVHATKIRGESKSRRGGTIAGRSASEIVAAVGNGYCLWRYDGASWSVLPQGYLWATPRWLLDFPLGALPSVAATPTKIWTAGAAGQLRAFDADVTHTVPQPPQDPSVTSLRVGNPALVETFTADRNHTTQVAIREGVIHSNHNSLPSAWTANGWAEIRGPMGSARPGDAGPIGSVSARAGELWAVGGRTRTGNDEPFAFEFTGGRWSERSVEPPPSPWLGVEGSQRLYFPASDDSVWMSSRKHVRKLGASGFEVVLSTSQLPEFGVESIFGGTFSGLGGEDSNDLWLAVKYRNTTNNPAQTDVVDVFSWQSDHFQLEHREELQHNKLGGQLGAQLVVPTRGAPWVFFDGVVEAEPRGQVMRRVDGAWQTFPAPFGVTAAYARNERDVYVLTTTSMLHHYDGTNWQVVFAADSLRDLAGDAQHLLLVGTYGATVRGTLPALPPK